MGAHRADVRRLLPERKVTAFAALPHDFVGLFKEGLYFDVLQKLEIAFFVSLFDGAHGTELRGLNLLGG